MSETLSPEEEADESSEQNPQTEESDIKPKVRKARTIGIKVNQPIRLSLPHASAELGMDRSSLEKKLLATEQYPGPDGKYSLSQVVSAKYGSRELEQTRNIREQADARAIENAKMRSQLVDRSVVIRYLSETAIYIKQLVIASQEMDQETKDQIILELGDSFGSKKLQERFGSEPT